MATPAKSGTGNTPLSLNEHAAQLRTQAAKLLETTGENKKAFRYQATATVIQSTIELCNRVFEQPMPAELKAMIHTLTQTIGSIKQDTTNIKHTTDIITTTAPS
ncbi:hypothetical protein B0A49_11944 [Cryomyces minteri]|uniref:Uncharacterized protein n=1 Tax=Cryomyces minteri TaxID=331657 RepID=A0A4U0W8J5_9PEZI|nr:hypothetical protein B0A49_11944 [Cryomyces minteri]